uniref:Uncharacterized protein n=1 Tax=Arundo donax TaxID=35708 RepID=A0A0A9DJX0_ARUDO
MDTGAGVGV